jgi:phosphoribosyl-dephospho-CoA transferase
MAAPDLKTHTLLRIGGPRALRSEEGSGLPPWVDESLQRAPWVVIRRAPFRGGLIPVGVRGESREQRFASWISTDAVLEYVTPQTLASCRSWAIAVDPARCAAVPALAALDLVESIMEEHHFRGLWGPGGSVGFELASERVTATPGSDLDLVVEVSGVSRANQLESLDRLWSALGALPVRIDVLLESPEGAVALSDYAQAHRENSPFVLRTTEGPRLIRHQASSALHTPARSVSIEHTERSTAGHAGRKACGANVRPEAHGLETP